MLFMKRNLSSNSYKILRRVRRQFLLFKNIILQITSELFYLFYTKFYSIFEFFKSKLNYNVWFLLVKLFCLSILVKSVLDVTLNYLGFPFEYKLVVSVNKYGFDFPSISVCTENNVLFDKRKIIEHFGLQIEWNTFENNLFREFKQSIDECNQTIQNYSRKRYSEYNDSLSTFTEEYELEMIREEIKQETIENPLKCFLKLNESNFYFTEINNRINIELSFYEMNSLTINVNELFDCSAKVHFRNESFDSNAHEFNNCFQYFDALKSIYSNKDFGICFEFFAKNYSIYLKDDDYIELKAKYSSQYSLLVNAIQEMNYRLLNFILNDSYYLSLKYSLKLFLDIYFGLYFFVDPKTRLIPYNREIAFKSTRNSLNAELMITKSSVELLGQPYMNKCLKYGKFDNFYSH